jgi:gliding motility-associated lipoprotein GldH
MPGLKEIISVPFFALAILCCFCHSCNSIDLYEKTVAIPRQEWKSSYKPTFAFTIQDTTVPYQVYIVLRHTDKYNYNNIWVNLYTLSPDRQQSRAQYELPLANNNKGWLATAIDDIYEHRVALTPMNQGIYFKKPGTYSFTIEHIMREDPLKYMLNVGLRVEKKER